MIGNIMSLALGLVGVQPLTWEKFKDRKTNGVGHKVSTYEPARPIQGSVQPVPQAKYQALGLDLNKDYVTLYTPAGVVSVARDGSGDRITWDGGVYAAESATPWTAQSGWTSVLCVRVKA